MLFSFTKAVFATLVFGVAAVSALPAPAPANAVAKRGGEGLLDFLADVKVDIDLELGKLDVLVAADVTVDVLRPIIAEIKVKLEVATTTVKKYDHTSYEGDSANDIAVQINVLIVAISQSFDRIKGLCGDDVTIIDVFADVDVSLNGLVNAILVLVAELAITVKLILRGLLGSIVGVLQGIRFTLLLNVFAIL